MIHLQKLSVGSISIESLAAWQADVAVRRAAQGMPALADHVTRMRPKQAAELLDNGSIYWVIKGMIQCRNPIVDLIETQTQDGRKACRIVLGPELIPVTPTPKRAFQGWRYLKPEDAPQDLAELGEAKNLPPHLRAKLVDLGAW